MKIEFPTKFDICYPEKNLKYYNISNKEKILNPLLKSCDYYCMYCGKSIKVDNKTSYNIEHSLEKSMCLDNNNFLKHCKFNLSISCPDCNQKYKTRMIDNVDKKLLKKDPKCGEKKCIEPCEIFYKILEDYLSKNKIILQPNSIKSILNDYKINYNLIKHIFVPNDNCTDDEKFFISEHIARFHLNREMYTESILNICEKIINNIDTLNWIITISQLFSIKKKERYDNILEKKFIDFLQNNFSDIQKLYDFCELSIVISYI